MTDPEKVANYEYLSAIHRHPGVDPEMRLVDQSKCLLCGAVVCDDVLHTAWHRSLYPAFLPPGRGRAEVIDEIARTVDRGMSYGQAVDHILRRLERQQ